VVGKGQVAASGSFTLTLDDNIPAVYLDEIEAKNIYGYDATCKEFSASVPSFKGVGLLEIFLEPKTGGLGSLIFQASSLAFLEDIFADSTVKGIQGKWITRFYADQDVTITGKCSEFDPRYSMPGRIDLSLKKGWNMVMLEVAATEVVFTTKVTNTPWLIAN
jgi:hypothetical protein